MKMINKLLFSSVIICMALLTSCSSKPKVPKPEDAVKYAIEKVDSAIPIDNNTVLGSFNSWQERSVLAGSGVISLYYPVIEYARNNKDKELEEEATKQREIAYDMVTDHFNEILLKEADKIANAEIPAEAAESLSSVRITVHPYEVENGKLKQDHRLKLHVWVNAAQPFDPEALMIKYYDKDGNLISEEELIQKYTYANFDVINRTATSLEGIHWLQRSDARGVAKIVVAPGKKNSPW